MPTSKMNVTLHMASYIAHPYWPEIEKSINIRKESGVSRARTQERREAALSQYLSAHSITPEQFQALEDKAKDQFYRRKDLEEQPRNPEEIMIPAHQLFGMLVAGTQSLTKALRPCTAENIRSVLFISEFSTGRTEPDGVWSRFVVVKAGPGNKLSNQRALRENEYLKHFDATGTIEYTDAVERAKLTNLLKHCGENIGIGASRKMGWGRFTVETR